MAELMEAVVESGMRVPYIKVDNPPRGGMKHTYFAPDKSYVVQFFNDPEMERDPNLVSRLKAITGRYNPTRSEDKGGSIGTDDRTAAYFAKLFCWPTALVVAPRLGIVCPAYGEEFFFTEKSSYECNLAGVDKRSTWFTTKRRALLARDELGDFAAMLDCSTALARAVRRMHQAGLAHSDLSMNNVLIDPKTGRSVVIDIDTLVVPGIYPPEVIGTSGYIAPEVLIGLRKPRGDPGRVAPSALTDLHALAVLIYEYLLRRHPLAGPKRCGTAPETGEEREYLMFGPEALYIEHPSDRSNRPGGLKTEARDLGPALEKLFLRAFVEGLRDPEARPTALEWERALEETKEMIWPCKNPACDRKWFILHDPQRPVCPFCGESARGQELLELSFYQEQRGTRGQWLKVRQANVCHHRVLYPWHVYGNLHPNEKTEPVAQAEVVKVNGRWALLNREADNMRSPDGRLLPKGSRAFLSDRSRFLASRREKGLMVEVSIRPL